MRAWFYRGRHRLGRRKFRLTVTDIAWHLFLEDHCCEATEPLWVTEARAALAEAVSA